MWVFVAEAAVTSKVHTLADLFGSTILSPKGFGILPK